MHKLTKIVLGVIFLLTITYSAFSQNEKLSADWLFIYYMPYDNNLSELGEQIIKMIGDNVRSESVIVTVQAEFSGSPGMNRYLITNNGIVTTKIEGEYSASINTYREYLEWVKEKVNYNKLAVVFLDHGGKLDEICLDEKPVYQFLKIDDISRVFDDIFGKKAIDLLFLQVCTKGVIEALYEFKDAAKYTLCSQIELGAPNDYYRDCFSNFSEKTFSSGREIAELIVNYEADNMYNSYTLVDNARMDSLFFLFSKLINHIKNKDIKLSSLPLGNFYFNERYWDIISLLENMPDSVFKTRLIDFINDELIIFHKISPIQYRKMNNYSGLSISGVSDNKYDKLDFYRLLQPIRELQK